MDERVDDRRTFKAGCLYYKPKLTRMYTFARIHQLTMAHSLAGSHRRAFVRASGSAHIGRSAATSDRGPESMVALKLQSANLQFLVYWGTTSTTETQQ